MGFKFNPFTGTLDIGGEDGGGGVESFNGRTGAVTLEPEDIPVDDSTLEVSNDETVIQVKDKGITDAKLSDELNSEIDNKAEASELAGKIDNSAVDQETLVLEEFSPEILSLWDGVPAAQNSDFSSNQNIQGGRAYAFPVTPGSDIENFYTISFAMYNNRGNGVTSGDMYLSVWNNDYSQLIADSTTVIDVATFEQTETMCEFIFAQGLSFLESVTYNIVIHFQGSGASNFRMGGTGTNSVAYSSLDYPNNLQSGTATFSRPMGGFIFGAETQSRLRVSDSVIESIDEKADIEALSTNAKNSNQKFFGGGEVENSLSPNNVAGFGGSGRTGIGRGFTFGVGDVIGVLATSTSFENRDLISIRLGGASNESFDTGMGNPTAGHLTCYLYETTGDEAGTPVGNPIAISNPLIFNSSTPRPLIAEFDISSPVPIQTSTVYAIVIENNTDIALDLKRHVYDPPREDAEKESVRKFNGSSWDTSLDQSIYGIQVNIGTIDPALSFTEDINVARPSLALEDNVIEAPEEPIVLDDGELLYVIPNEDDQGSTLTPTAATSETLPDNALVLAYRDGDDIIVDGVRLEPGQKGKLSQSPNIFDEFRYLDTPIPEDTETLIQTFSTAVYSGAWLEYQLRTASGNFKGGSIKIVTDAEGGNVATLVKHVETSIESDTPTDCDILVTLDTGLVEISVDNKNESDEAKISWFIRLTPYPTLS